MGNIDSILQKAVNQVNTPKEEPKVEQVQEPKDNVEEQLELITDAPKTKEEKKKFKVKAYGKEKELEVKDEEIPNYVQKGYAAEEKWKEAQDFLRQAQEIEKRMRNLLKTLRKTLKARWSYY
jgi:predicted nucleotide-binding protein (sugar kinase/HSP70/actin superfamily)